MRLSLDPGDSSPGPQPKPRRRLIWRGLLLLLVMAGPSLAFEAEPPLIHDGESFSDLEAITAGLPKRSAFTTVTFSPDGKTLLSGSVDRTLRLWDAASGKPLRTLQGHTRSVNAVAFSPDGKTLLSGSWDSTLRLWDAASGKPLRTLQGHTSSVYAVAFSPDGKTLLSGSWDKTLRLWNAASGKPLRTLQGHTSSVFAVAFSSEGKTLLSGAGDNTLRLWDAASGKPLRTLEGHTSWVKAVAFSPDGKSLASASHDGSLRLFAASAKHQLIGLFVSGQRGLWLACVRRSASHRCYRYDDGTLLLPTDERGRYHPTPPANAGPITDLTVELPGISLTVKDGEITQLPVTLSNHGAQRLYWINLFQVGARDKNNTNPLVFHPPATTVILEPGETREIVAGVSALGSFDHPASGPFTLDLVVTSARGEPLKRAIPVAYQAPRIEPRPALLERADGDRLQLAVAKSGGRAVSRYAYTTRLSGAGESLSPVVLEAVRDGTLAQVSFGLSAANRVLKDGADLLTETPLQRTLRHLKRLMGLNRGVDTTLSLVVERLDYPRHRWRFPDLPIVEPPPPWKLYLGALALLLATVLLVYWLRVYRHPLLLRLSQHPEQLPDLELESLNEAQRLLRRTRRLDSTLAQAGISAATLERAARLAAAADPSLFCATLAQRLQGRCETLAHTDLKLQTLTLPAGFLLNLQHCLLVAPTPDQAPAELAAQLSGLQVAGAPVCLLIGQDTAQRTALKHLPRDRSRQWVVPDGRELSRLLLDPDPGQALARLIASQVPLTRLSPYQTRGGVTKESLFFGRTQLLADILGGEPGNHLIVGGRQLGKSSLLQAIHRHYQARGEVECHYVSVSTSPLPVVMAPVLGLPPGSDMDAVWQNLHQSSHAHHRLMLIDEADSWLQQERSSSYPTLQAFRNLSEQRLCYFVFAGFWDLYYAASEDYQSPLKNFGASHVLGALEHGPCREMVTKPMAALNIHFANDALIEQLITATGGRANLIAIVCNAILKGLDPDSRGINAAELQRGLADPDLREALGGWGQLGGDAAANRLDQTIVYTTVEHDSFSRGELMEWLDAVGLQYQPQQLGQSLLRLELAFILGNQDGRFSYRVPLFREMVRGLEPERSLQRLVDY